MHDYTEIRRRHAVAVNQTLDQPIMVLESWELWEIFVALFWMVLFGAILSNWLLLFTLVAGTLIGLPYLRRHFNKGKAFHFVYSQFHVPLPGLIRPLGKARLSD